MGRAWHGTHLREPSHLQNAVAAVLDEVHDDTVASAQVPGHGVLHCRAGGQRARREEQRFAMLFGHGPSDGAPFGPAPLIVALVAIGLFFSAWLLVGDQTTSQETALDLQGGVPVIQEASDAVTPFTAQGLRADARR